ncbi:MAG: MFS transporter [Candidatus Puniceispirillales bacterium]
MSQSSSYRSVPFHSIGISQIISYGLLFYAFAQTKAPLAAHLGEDESTILAAITGSLILQGLMMPLVGNWIDRTGALVILKRGFLIGAGGVLLLPAVPSLFWFCGCMILIGIAHAMCTYESAFSAAVQMDESRSRRNISYITFYGGVASSITWLLLAPMLEHLGLQGALAVAAAVLLVMAGRFHVLAVRFPHRASQPDKPVAPFSWSILSRAQKQALIVLAMSNTLEYLVFAGTTLLWISWFSVNFGVGMAVILASIYGPFQVVGRMLEMGLGHRYDARWTAIVAFSLVPVSLLLAQSPSLPVAIVAMMLFGMGHGILTVSFGYVSNMYFSAEIYGRAKGWISGPRGIGTAIGPSLGGAIFVASADLFFGTMLVIAISAGICFASLLMIRPGNVNAG